MSKFIKKCLDIILEVLFFILEILFFAILFGIDEYITNYLFPNQKYSVIIASSLLAAVIMWLKRNTNKKSLLFYAVIIYITIPVAYWYSNSKDIETSSMFLLLVSFYNIFGFILFKLVGGLQITVNRKSLKLSVNIISALFVSLYKLNIGFPDNGYITILKDYKLITTIFFTVILVTGDLLLVKFKPLLENDNMMKELQTTESIFPTSGILIKIANSFLFISYMYMLYVAILKILYVLIK